LKIGVALSSALTVGVPLFVEIGRHSLRVFKSNLNDTRVSLRLPALVEMPCNRPEVIEIFGVKWSL
jgi:hypothetical protein